jgi:UDP:flavonoid glycosyltransferase YjiC (YdhE family)
MRALFYSVKGAGHTNPTLPLVRALVERGHQVQYVLTPEWKERIEALGAGYENTGEGATFTTADYNPQQPSCDSSCPPQPRWCHACSSVRARSGRT